MKLDEVAGVGKIVKGVNTTPDVQPGETERQTKKLFPMNKNGKPKSLGVPGASPNVAFNLGLVESENKKDILKGMDPKTVKAINNLMIKFPHAKDPLTAIIADIEDSQGISIKNDLQNELRDKNMQKKIDDLESRLSALEKEKSIDVTEDELTMIQRAEMFAQQAHKDHKRKYTGDPYYVHLDEVRRIVKGAGGSEDMQAAALLHDTVEDTSVTSADIMKEFGPRIAKLVVELTDISKPEDGNRATRKAMDRNNLAGASAEAQTIKYADLISNGKDIMQNDPKFAKVYMKEKADLLKVMTKGDSRLRSAALDMLPDELKENMSVTGTERRRLEKKKGLEIGSPEWFKHWFELPYLKKSKKNLKEKYDDVGQKIYKGNTTRVINTPVADKNISVADKRIAKFSQQRDMDDMTYKGAKITAPGTNQAIAKAKSNINRAYSKQDKIDQRQGAGQSYITKGKPIKFPSSDTVQLNMSEGIQKVDVEQLEKFADRLFGKVGIDVEFTRHFMDRVNDIRNQKPITMSELTRLFKQEYKRWGKPIAQMGPDSQAVMKDLQTDINLPFVLKWDDENNELDLIAKTVMRKADFKTPNKEFPVEGEQIAPHLVPKPKPPKVIESIDSFTDPNFEVEWDEAKRYPEFVKIGKDAWIELAKTGKPIDVDNELANKIENTEAGEENRHEFDNLEEPKKERFRKAVKAGTVELPIIARYSDGYLELVAGNTRLTGMMNEFGSGKAWIFDVPDEIAVLGENVPNTNKPGTIGQYINWAGKNAPDKPKSNVTIARRKQPEPLNWWQKTLQRGRDLFDDEQLELKKKFEITDELKKLDSIFKKGKHEIRIVGGAVRDLALGKSPKDIDLATDATPQEMQKMFDSAGVKHIPTGIEHGTITAVMNGEPYEITTLRADVETDGRRAEVEFVRSWEEDAKRRDLTYNAMSMDFDGNLYDYHGGMDDLQDKVTKFVGDPAERIKEDYLRTLRYFRFQGRLDTPTFDRATMSAIANNIDGLKQLSVERVWMEMGKILGGGNIKQILNAMDKTGVLSAIGLKYTPNNNLMDGGDPIINLARITDDESIGPRWKMSNEEKSKLGFLLAEKGKTHSKDWYTDMMVDGFDRTQLDALARYNNQDDMIDYVSKFKAPEFPVDGNDLIKIGHERGPKIGQTLQALRNQWKAGNFSASKDELLKNIKNESKGYFTRTKSQSSKGKALLRTVKSDLEKILKDIEHKLKPDSSGNRIIITVDKSDVERVRKLVGLPNLTKVVSEEGPFGVLARKAGHLINKSQYMKAAEYLHKILKRKYNETNGKLRHTLGYYAQMIASQTGMKLNWRELEQEYLNLYGNKLFEKITKRTPMGDVIDDFYKSDAPQFKGKSKEKRRQMAIAAKLAMMDSVEENFADGKKPGRKGLSKRVGIPKNATIAQLEKIAKNSTGERRRMAQWQLNMRRGKNKSK